MPFFWNRNWMPFPKSSPTSPNHLAFRRRAHPLSRELLSIAHKSSSPNHNWLLQGWNQGLYSLCGLTSYQPNLWNFESMIFMFRAIWSFWYLAGASAVLLPVCWCSHTSPGLSHQWFLIIILHTYNFYDFATIQMKCFSKSPSWLHPSY